MVQSGSALDVTAVEAAIADNKVAVFSKTTCPFCTKIKNLFEQMKVKIEVLELDQIRK